MAACSTVALFIAAAVVGPFVPVNGLNGASSPALAPATRDMVYEADCPKLFAATNAEATLAAKTFAIFAATPNALTPALQP
jgi:hypothetical protein